MSIETEYRGYTISYSENADEWNCYDCSLSNKSLAKLKAKIDAIHLKLRKEAAVECFHLGYRGALPATLIEYVGPEMSSGRWPETERKVTGHKVAAMIVEGKERPSRSLKRLDEFAPKTPEAEAAITAWQDAEREERRARKATQEALKAIPRLHLTDIPKLIEASVTLVREE